MFKKLLMILGAIVLLFIVLVACVAVVGSSDTDTAQPAQVSGEVQPDTAAPVPAAPEPVQPAAEQDAAQNIEVTKCEVTDTFGTKFANVSYTINNPTSEPSDYLFQVAVIDSTGASVSQASGYEANVLPGRPSQGEAMGNVSDSAAGPYTCEVADVTRMAS